MKIEERMFGRELASKLGGLVGEDVVSSLDLSESCSKRRSSARKTVPMRWLGVFASMKYGFF